ncbi:flagellar-associated protein, putative [Bodo saltans]|uniref:Flagellar-associated protein, putative n=1 Tax=Bodo saltans TaxID=75058 RepID=A0A0S4IT09_BODSA|nr:flagellar-associated protein, putative [Bodo saltans]|eukprot:CUE97556.1 flagellar-associated protein, putative [Bodo saltans]
MFKNTFQSGFLSILYSIGSRPLQIWDKQVRNGHIKRLTDQDIQSSVLELIGSNVNTCFISCPADANKTLGIKLPFLVMIIKNLKKYFTFEVHHELLFPQAAAKARRLMVRCWAHFGK